MHVTRRHGYTLIELLVVIAIIAILAAILFPVYSQAREQARAVSCLSNSRQLGLAVTMYADDHDEAYPCSCMIGDMMGAGSANMQSWLDTVQPYVRNRAIFRCPDDSSPLWSAMNVPRRSSYGFNGYFIPVEPPYFGIQMAEVANPASCVLIAELADSWNQDFFQPMYWGDPPKLTDSMQQMNEWDMMAGEPLTVAIRRHHEGANYVFAEGHAKWLRFAQTWRQTSGAPPALDMYDPKRE